MMSISINDTQNSEPTPSDQSSADRSEAADDSAAWSDKTPLPTFDRVTPQRNHPLKPMADTLPQLEAILRDEPFTPPPLPKHVYQVSSAQPDWNEYPTPVDEPAVESEPETMSGWRTVGAVVREIGETVLLTLVIFFLIQLVIRNFRVVGTSMVDNLHDGQYLIIDKLSYSTLFRQILGWSNFQHGDVVVFEPPNHPGEDYVKRIVGLPGETVEVRNGVVLVNGKPLPQPYQPRPGSYSMPPQVVPPGDVFVLGDNRNNSNDSHNWGPLPIKNIVGRAWISYWPPDEWGTIPRDAPTDQATLKHFWQELVPNANAGSQ